MLTLAAERVPVVSACGYTTDYGIEAVEGLIASGLVAQLVRRGRKPGGAVVRVLLLARENEIAHRSPQSTIQQVLPTTWTHRESLLAGY